VANEFLRDLEQLRSQRYQLVGRQAAMSLIHGLGQRIGDARAYPHHRDAKIHCDGIGGLEPDTRISRASR
jgi:hypothetical protein